MAWVDNRGHGAMGPVLFEVPCGNFSQFALDYGPIEFDDLPWKNTVISIAILNYQRAPTKSAKKSSVCRPTHLNCGTDAGVRIRHSVSCRPLVTQADVMCQGSSHRARQLQVTGEKFRLSKYLAQFLATPAAILTWNTQGLSCVWVNVFQPHRDPL
jgi:hypothetical protein